MSSKINLKIHSIDDVPLNIETDKLNTGDFLLFRGDKNDAWYDKLIEDVTKSPYEHSAIIVRDPWFSDFSGNGLYVIQTDGSPGLKGKTNTLTLNEMLNGRHWVDVRCWENVTYDENVKKNFEKFWKKVKNKPYDYNPCDWTVAGIHNLCCKCCRVRRTTKDFWCSALVTYGLVTLEWLPENTDWSNFSPCDLSKLSIEHPHKLGPIWRLL